MITEVDTDRPKTHGHRVRALKRGTKIIATLDWDCTACKDVRGDYSHFPRIHDCWAYSKLFAAAPSLLQHAKMALWYWEQSTGPKGETEREDMAALKQAIADADSAALAAAEPITVVAF